MAGRRPLKFRRRRSILPVEPSDPGAPRERRTEDSAMSLDVAPIGPTDTDSPTTPEAPARRAPAATPADTSSVSSGVPAAPPPEVLDAIGGAAARYDELAAQGRALAFATAEDGGVTVELRDQDGSVLRTLAPSEALDVATGAPVE
jgi:hypothetical protein